MRSFTINTGRPYAPEGQIIHIVEEDGFVSFFDESRCILGSCPILSQPEDDLEQIEQLVMYCYDNQLYSGDLPIVHKLVLKDGAA